MHGADVNGVLLLTPDRLRITVKESANLMAKRRVKTQMNNKVRHMAFDFIHKPEEQVQHLERYHADPEGALITKCML